MKIWYLIAKKSNRARYGYVVDKREMFKSKKDALFVRNSMQKAADMYSKNREYVILKRTCEVVD